MLYKDISKWFEAKVILEGGKVFTTNSSILKKDIPETLTNFYNEVLKPLNIKNTDLSSCQTSQSVSDYIRSKCGGSADH